MDNNQKLHSLLNLIKNNNRVDLNPVEIPSGTQPQHQSHQLNGIRVHPTQSAPIGDVKTFNPGLAPLNTHVEQVQPPMPHGNVTIPGDADFEAKQRALQHLRGRN